MKKKNSLPEWVTRGKSIRQLVKELKSFENQDIEARITFDDGVTHYPISILTRQKKGNKYYCMLENSELAFSRKLATEEREGKSQRAAKFPKQMGNK